MLRRSLAQIGGPYAVTFWAWLITLPLTVLISSVYSAPPTLRDIAVWTTALIGIHVAIGLVMLVARLTVLPGRPRPPRPATALIIFAILGVVRAVLLSVAQEWTGLGAFNLNERIAFNVVASMLIFSAIAIVIDEFRTDATIVRRLESAQQSLSALRAHESASLTDLDRRLLIEVQADLDRRLGEQDLDPAELRRMSDTVVRAMSHELAQPAAVPSILTQPIVRPSRWFTVRQVMQRMEFPSAFAVVGIFSLMAFGVVATRFGVVIALVNAVVGSIVTVLGISALRRWMPLPEQGWLRAVLILLLSAAVGAVAAVANAWELSFLVDGFPISVPAISAGVAGLSVVISVWVAAAQGRAERQELMTEAVADEAREVARVQGVLNERRLAAARFLHGTVQNELAAASLRGDSADAVRNAVRDAFASYGRGAGISRRNELEALLRSWSTVLDVSATIDPAAWRAVEADPDRGLLLVDIVSEGLTNAVRHGTGRSVTVEITAADAGLDIRILTDGSLRSGDPAGFGLHDLRERGAVLRLQAEGVRTALVGHLR